ncbi:MAG: dihydroneopterin aldolase [Chloroflexota bacterium]
MSDSKPSRDHILLEGMTFYAYHGANPEEKELGQRFVVNLQVELDLSAPGRSDVLADTVSYTGLYQAVKAVVEGERFNLLEAVAEAIAQRVLASFPPVSAVLARVAKVSPPIKGAILGKVAVEVYRHREG